MHHTNVFESLESRRCLAADLSLGTATTATLRLTDAEIVSHDVTQFVRQEGDLTIRRAAWKGQAVDVSAGEYVVTFDGIDGTPAQQRAEAQRRLDTAGVRGTIDDELGTDGVVRVSVDDGISPSRFARLTSRVQGIVLAEPNVVSTIDSVPNDTFFSSMWGLSQPSDFDIDATEAWDISTGDGTVIVAVLDSGVDFTHPDLAANIWTNPNEIAGNGIDDDGNGFIDDTRGWDFASSDNNPSDNEGHGTHVAGTIGAVGNNNRGVTGVAQNVKILPIRLGNTTFSVAASISAVNYINNLIAAGNNIRVANHSYGYVGSETFSFRNALNVGNTNGLMHVASAGNGGSDGIGDNNEFNHHYPSDSTLANMISVAATAKNGTLASYSNYGTTSVDLGAPGGGATSSSDFILSTLPGNQYGFNAGTSMASPHVAGALGLAAMVNPTATLADLRTALLDSAVDYSFLASRVASGGMLNLRGLLQAVSGNFTPSVPSTPILMSTDDSGQSASDTITNVNRPRFTGTAQANVTVSLVANGTTVGSTTASATGAYTVQPTVALVDGAYAIATFATNTAGSSSNSPTSSVTIDTLGAVPSGFVFNYLTSSHSVAFNMNDNVFPSFTAADISVTNLTGGGAPAPGLNYNPGTGAATASFGTTLADGRYRLTVTGSGIIDLAGNISSDTTHDFFFLRGDANHDAVVDVTDLGILSSNFRAAGNFTQGDFNYDGMIDVSDLGILSAAFRYVLPSAVASIGSPSSVFSVKRIGDDGDSLAGSVLG